MHSAALPAPHPGVLEDCARDRDALLLAAAQLHAALADLRTRGGGARVVPSAGVFVHERCRGRVGKGFKGFRPIQGPASLQGPCTLEPC